MYLKRIKLAAGGYKFALTQNEKEAYRKFGRAKEEYFICCLQNRDVDGLYQTADNRYKLQYINGTCKYLSPKFEKLCLQLPENANHELFNIVVREFVDQTGVACFIGKFCGVWNGLNWEGCEVVIDKDYADEFYDYWHNYKKV
jgi:hypothetical protein